MSLSRNRHQAQVTEYLRRVCERPLWHLFFPKARLGLLKKHTKSAKNSVCEPLASKIAELRIVTCTRKSASPTAHPSKSHPCNMPQAKTEVSLRFSESCAGEIAFSAVRMSFLPKVALQQTENCTATLAKLHCKKVALSCRFPADFKLPRSSHF